jgi:hypothetical protein
MGQKQETLEGMNCKETTVFHVDCELGNSKWKMGSSDGAKLRQVTVRTGAFFRYNEGFARPRSVL